MADGFAFRVTHRDGLARRGVLETPHGPVPTPVFMPVGTRATVKGVLPRDLAEMGARIVLGNTYHLYLRPGDALVARHGGLHRFMGWDGPTLTDSGGYQVFSLGDRCRLSEAGAEFRSHLDGSKHLLTPESAADIQSRLGADIAMVLDECTAYPAAPDVAARSLERTARWAARARTRHLAIAAGETDVVPSTPGQAQFGIVQGGVHEALRRVSAEATVAVGFEGYAIGGLSVGEPVDVMYDIVGRTTPHLPADQPRYLMGTGHARRPRRVGGPGDRHVRLRAADAQRPQRPAPDQAWAAQHPQRALCRRRRTGRRGVSLLHVPALFQSIFTASGVDW